MRTWLIIWHIFLSVQCNDTKNLYPCCYSARRLVSFLCLFCDAASFCSVVDTRRWARSLRRTLRRRKRTNSFFIIIFLFYLISCFVLAMFFPHHFTEAPPIPRWLSWGRGLVPETESQSEERWAQTFYRSKTGMAANRSGQVRRAHSLVYIIYLHFTEENMGNVKILHLL